MNNYEKIKSMSIEEMAHWLCQKEICCDWCRYYDRKDCGVKNPFVEWLKSEAQSE